MQTHAIVMKSLRGNGLRVFWFMIGYASLRLIAFLPLLLPMVFPDMFSFLSVPIEIACCVFLCAVLLLPSRFHGARFAIRLVDPQRLPAFHRPLSYRVCFRSGLFRLAKGILWSVPFIVFSLQIYFYWFVYEASRAGETIEKLGQFLSPLISSVAPHTLGVGLILFLFLACFFLFLYGWRRGVPFDYLVSGAEKPTETWRIARQIRSDCKKQLWFNAVLSFVLLLIPLAGFVLTLMIRGGSFSQGFMMIYLAVTAGIILDPRGLTLAAIVFLILYVPFVPYRKARNALVIIRSYEKRENRRNAS